MSTSYDDLKTALTTEANTLTDAIDKARALVLVDQYIAALTQQANATASNVSAYSISNRSVTRTGTADYQATVDKLWRDLCRMLYGSVVRANLRASSEQASIDPRTNREV